VAKPKRKLNEEEKPELITGIIVRSQAGETEQQIADAIGLSRHQVRQLKSSPEYLDLVRKQKEEAEKRVVSFVAGQLEDMAPLFVKGLKKNLEEGDPSSLRLYAEMAGLKAKEGSGDATVGGITVILPGAKEEKSVESTIVLPEGE
jgi:predicted transcriptional regulator